MLHILAVVSGRCPAGEQRHQRSIDKISIAAAAKIDRQGGLLFRRGGAEGRRQGRPVVRAPGRGRQRNLQRQAERRLQRCYNASQLDCIDESKNTTTLLKLIEKRGWLSHHRVGRPKHRGFLLDLRYPHNTATVIEKDSGEAWAIDSWIPANAAFPDIMPLKIWVTKGVRGQN